MMQFVLLNSKLSTGDICRMHTHVLSLWHFRHSGILLISCSGSLWFVSTEVFRSVSETKYHFQSNLSNPLLKVVISQEEVVL